MRKRLKLKIQSQPRPNDYFRLRYYWLHELRVLRAKRRITQTATIKDIKAAQKCLAKLRVEYV